MNKIAFVEGGIKTIYHEIGHIFGYCLANQKSNTYLGEIVEFSIGREKSCVGVENSYYHLHNVITEKERILNNTKNKARTIAWFIEVISGCTFQTLFENKDFNLCFGYESSKGGNNDYSNILIITSLCSFKFNMHDIFDLQEKYSHIIRNYNLINQLQPIISEIKTELIASDNIQVNFGQQRINYFYDYCKNLITQELYNEYEKLIVEF
ncbi:hypothetical protein HZQ28_12420 [Elizabethkingia anophelis]|nr:hypothetical protein [Elizabethkingia anophelis]MCT3995300.1 hypothetical protein [Elizabethkingia anophelis]MCT3998790.1 hypothetical protein [Elizabethkingia anophelis]MCT4255678.1 hypothetical protein [Elizabethkingia anophelis]MDV3561577.1 hypothetical protein [Elizabethkingia anophelis]